MVTDSKQLQLGKVTHLHLALDALVYKAQLQ